jgi:predicted kinase
LIILCGLPGSGKTTRAKALVKSGGGVRLSPDDWMDALSLDLWDEDRRAAIEELQWQVARELIALAGTAIIEWGTWQRVERDRLRLEGRALGAAVELIHMQAEPEVLLERISRRGHERPPITLQMIKEWTTAFQAPTEDELALFDSPTKRSSP